MDHRTCLQIPPHRKYCEISIPSLHLSRARQFTAESPTSLQTQRSTNRSTQRIHDPRGIIYERITSRMECRCRPIDCSSCRNLAGIIVARKGGSPTLDGSFPPIDRSIVPEGRSQAMQTRRFFYQRVKFKRGCIRDLT